MADEKKGDKKKKALRIAKKDYFKLENGKLTRTRKHCPKCGPGVFMAEHPNRVACGKCGYTEFKKK
ncbi:MAG TPA: 30S ribosomal protein S27ae [Thermoplasmata archaeon]|jgi:small subunit ribosomal protein S27Ae